MSTSCINYTPKLFIDLELTNQCMARCVTCPRDMIKDPGYMSDGTFRSVLDKLKRDTVERVTVCGFGESLLHPKVVEHVQALCSNGFRTALTTNALLLDEPMQQALLDAGLRGFIISMPSVRKDVFEKIHQGLDHRIVMQNVHSLLTKKDSYQLNIVFFIVLSRLNEDHIKETIDFCRAHGIGWHVIYITNRGFPGRNRELYPHRKDLIALPDNDKIENLCSLFSANTFVGHDGQVYPCCNDVQRKYPLGFYKDMPMEEIITQKKHTQTAQALCRACDYHGFYKELFANKFPFPYFSIGYQATTAHHLGEVLTNVLQQAFPNFELIIYLDAPLPDEAERISEILAPYLGHAKVRVFHAKHRRGKAFSKKRMAELARGKVFIPLNDTVRLKDYSLEVLCIYHLHTPKHTVVRGGLHEGTRTVFPKVRQVHNGQSMDHDDLLSTYSIDRTRLLALGNYPDQPSNGLNEDQSLFAVLDRHQEPIMNLQQVLFERSPASIPIHEGNRS